MKTEIGEYIVGAHLKIVEGCDVVSYNVRPPGGGHASLGELDVVGFHFGKGIVYVCEVTTHICGVLYKNYDTTVQKVTDKHLRQRAYAQQNLQQFKDIRYQFWSPVVPSGLVKRLHAIRGMEIVVNEAYTSRVDELRARAKKMTEDTNNPFFRTLQILERLRRTTLVDGRIRS